jgi:protein-S-isoprenylcysteine O-methyltransferase Ste14
LGVSLVFLVWGFVLLRRKGDFSPAVETSPGYEWEKTGHLVTSGIYGYVRHPMYSSLLFLASGAVLKSVSISTLLLGAVASLALAATAKTEEAEIVVRVGQDYRDYMRRTRRFVPFLF